MAAEAGCFLSVGRKKNWSDQRQIGEVVVVLNLGVYITCDMKFTKHIAHVLHLCASTLNLFFRCFIVRKTNLYIHLYNNLILPRLMYCSSVFWPHQRYLLVRFSAVEKTFIRRLNYHCSSSDLTLPNDLSCSFSAEKYVLHLPNSRFLKYKYSNIFIQLYTVIFMICQVLIIVPPLFDRANILLYYF